MPSRTEHPHYELVQICGRGAMGVVYQARDKRLDRVVALKFLGAAQADRPGALSRFRREALAIAALNHPNVAVVYEIGEWDGEPFLALEYLPGGTLRDRIQGRRLELDEILRLASQLGAGLDFTHRRGILHRDIKPANSMFSMHGDLKLVDFGLAKLEEWTDLTRPGGAMGTIPYMAPEVLNGEPASIRSDIYSFGALIFELAAGRPMFEGSSTAALCKIVLEEKPQHLSLIRPDLPASLGDAIAHAVARNPQDRPASVADLLAELNGGSTIPLPASMRATQTLAVPSVGKRRHPALLIAAVAVGLALGALAIPWMRHLAPSREVVAPVDQTVVVLPFENLGSDSAIQALTLGLQETVTSMMASTASTNRAILVVPSLEVRRNQVNTIHDAQRLFHATLALSGTVQKSSDGLQITLALTNAHTVRQMDSSIIRIPADATGLQKELEISLAKLFRAGDLPVPVRPQTPATVNSGAYALYVEGLGALNNRSYEQAIKLLGKAVQADPTFALAHAKLALAYVRAYMQNKDQVLLAKSDTEANRAAAAGVTPEVLLVRALIRDATGQADQAIDLFRQYQQAEPNDAEAYGLLADILNKAGRVQDAEDTMQQAIRLRPGYWPTYQRLGVFYYNHQQFEKSEHSYVTGIGLAPESASLHFNLGALYFAQNRWHDAAGEFEKSLAIRPNATAYSNLGTVRFFEGNFQEAARQDELATKMQPNNAINWGNLGDALWQLPNGRTRAREAFTKAAVLASEQLGLDPANSQLRKNYAIYLVKLGRQTEADREIRRALAQAPKESADFQFFAARVYVLEGKRAEALDAVSKAVALGYSPGEISHDPDLAPLHSDVRFQQLVAAPNQK